MEIKTVGVIGAGTMGNGIAHVLARSGCHVVLVEAQQAALDRGLQAINKNLEREVGKNKITAQERESALKRIDAVLDRRAVIKCDFVIEAAFEKFEIKQEIFRDLDQFCRPDVILSSNTSSI
ncbi:MAG TPA: 3-hydroxyacyl-CoA dehydrogenase NAD-binding domain-containing protein, partial [Candidatus Angelobacter sp.]|nr:3-hydroxyacyl-CoA dehydrogenase NAD-binding domain-containing protein [Candidatus Angelobacter sp.]